MNMISKQENEQQQQQQHDQHPAFGGCDKWPLHYACRLGNLNHVRYLVSTARLPVNQADDHDATPLYLAALTGNEAICQYLLEQGATCDPKGGDAARVFYVALTPKLRHLLQTWSLSAATRDIYLELLRNLFNNHDAYSDCYCNLQFENQQSRTIYLHRIILWARCPSLLLLHQQDGDNDMMSRIVLPSLTRRSESWSAVLEYLYTGQFKTTNVQVAKEVATIAQTFHLTQLLEPIQAALLELEQQQQLENETNNGDMLKNKKNNKFSNRRRGLFNININETNLLKQDIQTIITQHDNNQNNKNNDMFSDVKITCHGKEWNLHRAFVCSQSDYFDRALCGNFREATESSLDLSHLTTNHMVVQLLIEWMYCGTFLSDSNNYEMKTEKKNAGDAQVNILNAEYGIELLHVGSILLCPRLCTHVANVISIDLEHVFELYNLAKFHGLERLEDRCVVVMAENIIELGTCDDEPLVELLVNELSEIIQGGDERVTDIPVAAEIASTIYKEYKEKDERQRRLHILRQTIQKARQKHDSIVVSDA